MKQEQPNQNTASQTQGASLIGSSAVLGQANNDKLIKKMNDEISELLELNPAVIGRSWIEDSSLEKWFPITAEELKRLRHENDVLCDFINREVKMTGSDPRIAELQKRIAAWPNDPKLSHGHREPASETQKSL